MNTTIYYKYYTVYKITNNVNGKIYIGQHQTNDIDDGYMGSGKAIRLALKKYGRHNFTKEILFIYDNFDDMNSKEKELVNEEFISRDDTYNIAIGGCQGIRDHSALSERIKNGLANEQNREDRYKRAAKTLAETRKNTPEHELRRWQDAANLTRANWSLEKKKQVGNNISKGHAKRTKEQKQLSSIMSVARKRVLSSRTSEDASIIENKRKKSFMVSVKNRSIEKKAKINKNITKGRQKGFFHTPFGVFIDATAASRHIKILSDVSITKYCKFNERKVTKAAVASSKYLTASDIGKSFESLGFSYIPL